MPMAATTRMATRTIKSGSVFIAMPQVTCKLTAGKERQPELDRNRKPLEGQNKAVREVGSKEENGLPGHLRQSSGEGCHSIKNQNNFCDY